jgi:hypothetical protein
VRTYVHLSVADCEVSLNTSLCFSACEKAACPSFECPLSFLKLQVSPFSPSPPAARSTFRMGRLSISSKVRTPRLAVSCLLLSC